MTKFDIDRRYLHLDGYFTSSICLVIMVLKGNKQAVI